MSKLIHPTIVKGDNVVIGKDTEIGPFVVIGDNVAIGDNVIIKPFCEIRDDAKIGNNVFLGSRCLVDNNTVIEDNVVMKYGSAATDTPSLTELSKKSPCHIKRNARIGANVTLMPGVAVGSNSEIGACSQVRHDIPDNEIWFGSPAKFHREVK